jgi:hypothetical protein
VYFRVARVVAVVVLALVVYVTFVRTSHPDPQTLSSLVIKQTSQPGLRGRAPSVGTSVPASASTFTPVKLAAKAHPGQTGLYETEWYKSTSAAPEAGIVLTLLPNASSAQATLSYSEQQLTKPLSLQSGTSAGPVPFPVASVPGAHGASFALTTSGKPSGYAYEVDFRSGRAVVSDLMVSADKTRSTAAAVADAQAEKALLGRAEPGYSLTQLHTPVVATVVFALVTVAVALAAWFVPEWAVDVSRRRRERRRLREQDRLSSQYRARGRRAVQRHKAPAWRQPSRR